MRYFSKLFSCSEQLFFREQDAWDLLQLGAADGLNDRSGPMEDGGGWVGDFVLPHGPLPQGATHQEWTSLALEL